MSSHPRNLLLSISFLLLAGPAGAAPTLPVEAVREEDRRASRADHLVPVLLETSAGPRVADRVRELGGEVQYVFRHIDAVSARVPADAMDLLRQETGIDVITRQRLVHRAIVEGRVPGARESFRREERGEFPYPAGLRPLGVRALPVEELGSRARGSSPASFVGYDQLTGAAEVGEGVDYGEGVLVAIIDSGVHADHPMLDGNVIGGMNLVPAEEEEAIDLNGDGSGDGRSFDWDAVQNDGHGTFVAGIIAGHAELTLPADDPFTASVSAHAPDAVTPNGEGTVALRLVGTAPGASLYGVKVFPYDGGGAPDARVAEALDRLITMKESGELDVHVVNLSLSGPVLWDGRNPLDRMVDAATAAGITCVVAASNDGPSLVSVGSPGSARTALTVGAVMDPMHTRVAVEQFFGGPAGSGAVIYPHEGLQLVDFSSRGLTADRRLKPDLLASGFFLFSSTLADLDGDDVNDTPFFSFSSGTSHAAPAVSGAAALVLAHAEDLGRRLDPDGVAGALTKGALPIADYDRVSRRKQGSGFVNLPNAFELVESGRVHGGRGGSPVEPMMRRDAFTNGFLSGECPPLGPGESYDFFVDVPDNLFGIEFTFPAVFTGADQNPVLGDGLEVAVHTAKRGGSGDYRFFAGPVTPGDSFVLQVPEPGTIRVTMMGFPTNYGEVSGTFEAAATQFPFAADHVMSGRVRFDGTAVHRVDVPEGLDALLIRLNWSHDWDRFPTFDLDMLVETPMGVFPMASLNSPELAAIEDPPAGTWTFYLRDFSTVRGSEHYSLEIAEIHAAPLARAGGSLEAARPRVTGVAPNPAAPDTDVQFSLPAGGRAIVEVFDVAGRRVNTLLDEELASGSHEVRWSGRSSAGLPVADGVYFLRLSTEAGTSTRKVVLRR